MKSDHPCNSCVFRDTKNNSICNTCSRFEPPVRPRFKLEDVNIFELAEGLKKKRDQEKLKSENDNDDEQSKQYDTIHSKIKLDICPKCGNKSLLYIRERTSYECVNHRCRFIKSKYPGRINVFEDFLKGHDKLNTLPDTQEEPVVKQSPHLKKCPRCGEKSVWRNVENCVYECLNASCKSWGFSEQDLKD